MSSSDRLKRISTVDALVDALKARILSGEIEQGYQLREEELTEQYGVGRNSVRAALQALTYEGLATHRPNQGVFVTTLAAEDIGGIFDLRIALEAEAIQIIVESSNRFEQAEQAVKELRSLTKKSPVEEVIKHDFDFHWGLILAAGSKRIERAYSLIESEVKLCIARHRPGFENPKQVAREHQLVLEQIVAGDACASVDHLRAHLKQTAAELIS